MPGIKWELAVFLHAVVNGIFGFALYLSLKTLRKLISHKSWMTQIEDACYWMFMGGYLFVQIYHTNNGKIRWYSILGVVFGCFFMWKIFRIFKNVVEKMYVFIRRKMGKSS